MFKLGYNTNGFAHHSLGSAIEILSSLGYQSIAITIDHGALNPWDRHVEDHIPRVKKKLEKHHLSSVIETGARFLLNPWKKHDPTLISPDPRGRQFRMEFIEKCIGIAAELGSDAVSIWSGVKPGEISDDRAWEYLVQGCRTLCRSAQAQGVFLAFEPEPGMFVETISQFKQLKKQVGSESFKLTFDAGHAFITEKDVPESIRSNKEDIVNVHLEDMQKHRHIHLEFGEGEMAFGPIFNAFKAIQYRGQVNIELSRNSHDAVETAARSIRYLQNKGYLGQTGRFK